MVLPKEMETHLPKSILRTLWSNKVIVEGLGLRNELEAREWFRLHPEVHYEFELMNNELQLKILELQNKAKRGLQELVVQERLSSVKPVFVKQEPGLCKTDSMNF